MSGQKATIAGTVIVAEGPVTWPIRSGTSPTIESFKMPRAEAERIVRESAGKQIELVISDDGGKTLTVKALYALRVEPGEHKHFARLVVADRRWLWPYCHIIRRYNMNRSIGYYRAVVPGGRPEINEVVEDVFYARWSLQGTEIGTDVIRWTPAETMKDVVAKLSRFEKKFSGTSLPISLSPSILNSDQSIPVEQLEIDDSGDAAMARTLAHFGLGEVTIDAGGNVKVWTRADGMDQPVIDAITSAEMVGRGHIEVVDRYAESPAKIKVGFTKEHELRIPYVEDGLAATATITDDNTLAMDNVLPVPDYQLLLTTGETVSQGTWITVSEALNAWAASPPPGLGRLDYDILRKAFLPFIDLWAAIQISGQRNGDVDWAARISALQQHFRKTFRIRRRWMDRILTLRPFRVATIHPVTGTRAPAIAYCDYSLLASQRSLWKNAGEGKSLDYAVNMTGWAATLDDTVKPAPARVSILDHDQGVIHIDFLQDPARVYDCILPGQVLLSTMPGHNFRDPTSNIGFNSVIEATNVPTLDPSFKCDVILTAVPASPNTEGQLHWETVTPQDVQGIIPPALQSGIGKSKGPTMEIRVGPGIETARVAWSDADSDLILQSFGINQDKEPANGAAYADITDLIANRSTGNAKKAAGIRQIAIAVAAREWARFATRPMGHATSRMNPDLVPAGFVSGVNHALLPNGEAVTTIDMMPEVPQLDLLSVLSGSTRAIIMRSPQAGK